MSDVKWIKITTDIFDDEKILLIESMPDADALIVIWFKLLCLAGKQNNSGVFMMNDRIPYTDKMLATIFRRKESVVQYALQTFEEFGMVELVDGVITIPNWEKHQSLEKLEHLKALNRERVARHREKQKLLSAGSNEDGNDDVMITPPLRNATDKIRKEEDKIRIEEREDTPYQAVASLFNQVCVSFPQVRSLSDARRKAIRARLNSFTLEDIETVFRKAEASDFLKGRNNRNWQATFDWLLKDANFSKVLDGNYDNSSKKSAAAENLDSYYSMVQQWADGESKEIGEQ